MQRFGGVRWEMMRRAGAVAIFLYSSLAGLSAQSNDPALRERLHRAEALTSLDTAGLEPWHLRMNVALNDVHGKQREQGTIEEWWSSPRSYRVTFAFPSYANTVVRTEEGSFSNRGDGLIPYYIEYLWRQVVHPIIPLSWGAESKLELGKKKSGAIDLDLLSFHPTAEQASTSGYHQTYYFENGKDSLLASSDFAAELATRTKMGKFREKSVALAVVVQANGRVMASSQVEELKGQSAPYNETKDSSGLAKDSSPTLESGGGALKV